MLNNITNEMLEKIEHVFGFPLYDWQKRYLQGDDTAFPRKGRQNGKTFAYGIRLLLDDRPRFRLSRFHDVVHLADGQWNLPSYVLWFYGYLRELNDVLCDAGFRTNAKE